MHLTKKRLLWCFNEWSSRALKDAFSANDNIKICHEIIYFYISTFDNEKALDNQRSKTNTGFRRSRTSSS